MSRGQLEIATGHQRALRVDDVIGTHAQISACRYLACGVVQLPGQFQARAFVGNHLPLLVVQTLRLQLQVAGLKSERSAGSCIAVVHRRGLQHQDARGSDQACIVVQRPLQIDVCIAA
ncbi:hypothetical protein D3C81_1497500 [compost metagenome]